MIELSIRAQTRDRYAELFIRAEPNYRFAESGLGNEDFNKAYYARLAARTDAISVETFRNVTICWFDVSKRDVDLIHFDGLFAVVDRMGKRVEFVLAYDTEFLFGVECAVNIRQWTSPRISSLAEMVDDRSLESVSSFVITGRLLRYYPVVAAAGQTARRFWWAKFGCAARRGYLVFESDNGKVPVVLSDKELRDRNWPQPKGREFPGIERVAIIAKNGTW